MNQKRFNNSKIVRSIADRRRVGIRISKAWDLKPRHSYKRSMIRMSGVRKELYRISISSFSYEMQVTHLFRCNLNILSGNDKVRAIDIGHVDGLID